ncbi:MAG TPA: outer membrane lipid asymmetry maintenance protein MlaD [Gammaproteobacteria bacterium]|nr:outer membrane lipid asymmetry maintenance protein MlaD [Gammaproteobacteria bacterium]
MTQTRMLETVVGLFICLGVAAIFILTLRVSNMGNLTGGSSYQVTALFQDIGGLKVGAPVTMAGVQIGRVSNIGFDQSRFEAKVTISIKSRYDQIPKDSNASIFTQGLLGEQYVSLTPGGSEKVLKNGDKIAFTQSALVLEKVIGQFLVNKASSGGK